MAGASYERMADFLAKWIDANITHPAEPATDDVEGLCRRYLTDAVAAGYTLDEVNARWPETQADIARAFR